MPDGTAAPPSLQRALSVVGDRWSLAVVDALRRGPRRFGEIQASLGEVSPNVLSARLKQLSGDRVVLAQPYSDRPVRFAYELTALGRGLLAAADVLAQWGLRLDGARDAEDGDPSDLGVGGPSGPDTAAAAGLDPTDPDVGIRWV